MTSCSRCDDLNAPALVTTGAGGCVLLYVPAPLALAKTQRAAVRAGYGVERPDDGVLLLTGDGADWSGLLGELEASLSTLEADEIRVAPIGGLPSASYAVALAALKSRTLSTVLGELHDTWLPRALDTSAITSHFQPIVDLESGRLFAHEALIRATRDDGTLVGGGKIVEAGRRLGALHVIDQAGQTSAIRRAHQLGLETLLFINFFPTVVYDPVQCLRATRQAMRETGMRPEQIVFEVVESERIADRDHLLSILAHYRSEGFRVALDDLGSGYSSLNLLAALRPDFVKLDMELAREVAGDPLRRSLVEALVKTAQDYGIQVIAEGVETVESARVLAELGVRLLQGYLFGRPAPEAGTLSPALLAAVRGDTRGRSPGAA